MVLVLPLKKSDCNFQTWPTLPLMFIRLKLRLEKYPCLVVSSHHHANNINANNNNKNIETRCIEKQKNKNKNNNLYSHVYEALQLPMCPIPHSL